MVLVDVMCFLYHHITSYDITKCQISEVEKKAVYTETVSMEDNANRSEEANIYNITL